MVWVGVVENKVKNIGGANGKVGIVEEYLLHMLLVKLSVDLGPRSLRAYQYCSIKGLNFTVPRLQRPWNDSKFETECPPCL